jgi:hypothetical protein
MFGIATKILELPIWMASHEPGQNAPWSVSQHSKGFSLEGPVLCLLSLLFSSLRSNRACQAAGLRLALCQSRQGLPSPFAEGHGHRARSTAVAPAREQEARWWFTLPVVDLNGNPEINWQATPSQSAAERELQVLHKWWAPEQTATIGWTLLSSISWPASPHYLRASSFASPRRSATIASSLF